MSTIDYERLGLARIAAEGDHPPVVGEAVVTRNGRVFSIGAWSDGLLESVLTRVLADAGVPATPLPEGVRVARRGSAEVWMNFNQEAATLPDGSILGPVSFRMSGYAVRPVGSGRV